MATIELDDPDPRPRDQRRADQPADEHGDHAAEQQHRIDQHAEQDEEDDAFGHRRRGQADEHGRRDQPVGHHAAELEPGGGRRERADAERVEEVHDRAEDQRFPAGLRCAAMAARTRIARNPRIASDRGTRSAISIGRSPPTAASVQTALGLARRALIVQVRGPWGGGMQ